MKASYESDHKTFDRLLKEPYPQWTLDDALERIRELAAENAELKRFVRWRGAVIRALCGACVLIAIFGYVMVRVATP